MLVFPTTTTIHQQGNGAECDSSNSSTAEQVLGEDQWESKAIAVVASSFSSMPIGNLLQRVSKLVIPTSSKSSNNNISKDRVHAGNDGEHVAADQSDMNSSRRKSSLSEPVLDEDVAGEPRRQSSRDRKSESRNISDSTTHAGSSSITTPVMKRASSELERSSASTPASSDMLGQGKAGAAKKKTLPASIKTSHLSPGQQPLLSVTPATPITPTSPSASASKSLLESVKKEGSNSGSGSSSGKTRFHQDGGSSALFTSSSPSNLSGTKQLNGRSTDQGDKKAEGEVIQEEEDHSASTSSESAILPEGDNRNSSLVQQEGNEEKDQIGDDDDDNESAIVLDEPEQMTEEDENRLHDSQSDKRRSMGQSWKPNDDHSRHTEEATCTEDDKGPNTPPNDEEDHPDMLPPRAPPQASSISTSTSQHPRIPALPKPSLLQRLPSQVISESPSSEYAPTPSTSGRPSRQPSLNRGESSGGQTAAEE